MVKRKIRRLSFLFSYVVVSLLEDPLAFVDKFLTRLGLQKRPRNLKYWRTDGSLRFRIESNPNHFLEYAKSRPLVERILNWRRILNANNQQYLLSVVPDEGRLTHPPGSWNVLWFLTNASPQTNSGYTVRTDGLLQGLRKHGVKVKRVTRLGYPLVIGKFASRPPEDIHFLIPWIYPLRAERRLDLEVALLSDIVSEERFTVLHTTTGYRNAVVVSRVATKHGIPWVYEMRGEPHNTWIANLPEKYRRSALNSQKFQQSVKNELTAAKKASGVIVLSELQKRDLVTAGVDPKKILVAPNGYDDAVRDNPEAGHSEQSVKWVGTVSSLVEYEGIEYLIRAIDFLPPEIKIAVVGGGKDEARLKSLAAELSRGDDIHFIGKVSPSEAKEWYGLLNVFCIPRRNYEVCRKVTPVKPLIAMRYNIPIVASDLPALREVTGNFGVYVEPENPEALAAGIVEALVNSQLYLADSSWVRSRAWSQISRGILDLYANLDGEKEM